MTTPRELLARYVTQSQMSSFFIDKMRIINVKSFGAKGDGVTDDTAAFKAANAYILQNALFTSSQIVPTATAILYIPTGIYVVKGNRVFGSIAQGYVDGVVPIMYTIEGNGATILWDIGTPDDILFYFDYTLDRPTIKNLNIFVTNNAQQHTVGGTVFHFDAYQDPVTSKFYAASSKGRFESLSVCSGRSLSNFNFSTRPKFVFKSLGSGMSDQALVINSRFWYFETLFYNENQESVVWTFKSCGFYAGGWTNSVYFSFTKLGDNFNVESCSFSVSSNETLIKTRSARGADNKFTQTAHFNFNFKNNRIELYGNPGTSWFLCDMDFGRLNMSNSNLKLASGAANVKTIVSAYGLANINFENVAFYKVEFRLPILISDAIIGVANAYGALLRNCDFIRGETHFKYYDGLTVYELKDILISTLYYRHLKVENCTYLNSNGFLNFEIVNCITGLAFPAKHERRVSFSTNGVATENTYVLPPYQAIKNIVLNMFGTHPTTFNKFRLYFGDKSLANYIDIENPKPDTERKSEFCLFEGIATIFNDNLNFQSITVYELDSGVEKGGSLSEITVTYVPLDVRVFNITTNANTIVILRKSRTISSGTTAQRPAFDLHVGQTYFDTTLSKPIWWDGSAWRDAAGTVV